MNANANGRLARGLVSVRADANNSPEMKPLLEALNKAFADFREANDRRVASLEKGQADVLQALETDRANADVSRLQAAVDAVNTQLAAIQMGGGAAGGDALADAEYSGAFLAHFRKGEVQAAMNKGVADDGGYLAPVEWDRTITGRLVVLSDMRQLANVVPCSGTGLTKLYNMGGTASGWVGEEDARPATATGKLKQLGFGWGEVYANPGATQQLLDDSEIDLEAWLSGEVDTEFARQEGAGFFAGDGVNKPFGILTYVTGGANAAKHPFGAISAINSGAAATITADGLIDLVYDLPSAFTANARFAMNRKTMGAVRKLKDAEGNYLWQPSLIAGQPSTLLGFPVQDVAAIPDVAANAIAALFGDFKQTYTVYDRKGVRVLRDPFTNKPYVHFYTTKRVGGGVHNPEPMRALKIAA